MRRGSAARPVHTGTHARGDHDAGSRGDVAPYTGLGAGLARSGHEVTLATHALFEPLTAGSGVRFHPTPVDPHAVSHSDQGRDLHASTPRGQAWANCCARRRWPAPRPRR
ncbi:glycosyltransferase [Streptomyces massasporeus]|uniref:glycosyltransferase n=1 Tax=Streptomyces massasporeus TaxID=67324 RepID=UPI003F4D6F72